MITLTAMPARTSCIEYWANLGEPALQTVFARRVYRALVLEGPAFTLGFSADPAIGVTARLATIGAVREFDFARRTTISAIWGFWAGADVLARHKWALLRRMRDLLRAEAAASKVLQALAADDRAARFVEHFGFSSTGRRAMGLDVLEKEGH